MDRAVPSVKEGVDVSSLSDHALVDAALQGDAQARAEIFHRHWRLVWRRAYLVTGRHAAADDITQDTFERAFRRLSSYDRDNAPLAAWLQRIAVNRAIDLLRSERRLTALEAAAEVGAWDEEPTHDPALRSALAGLDADRRAVLVLRFWLDLSGPEIAEALDLPLGTVHSRLARGLQELRAVLGEETP